MDLPVTPLAGKASRDCPQLTLGVMRAADLPCEQEWIHEKYMGELLSGVVRPETRAGLRAIVEQLRNGTASTGCFSPVPSCRCSFARTLITVSRSWIPP